jgi:sugar/nucleoside kinase (ribokinase family)
VFSTGGGATNAAVTFARAGFHSCFLGKLGRDSAGSAVLDELHRDMVDTSLVKTSETGTGYSVILLSPDGERTVLTYRGSSDSADLHTYRFNHVSADWFYITTLDGNFQALKDILDYAKEKDIQVALNPGQAELAHPERLKNLLPRVSVLISNKDEMEKLFKVHSDDQLVRAANLLVRYVAMTDGPGGVLACDGVQLVKAGMYEDVPVIDRTGAGDAFGSGFTAMIAAGEGIGRAIQYGSANSTSVVGKIGAKAGIIKLSSRLHSMPMEVRGRS